MKRSKIARHLWRGLFFVFLFARAANGQVPHSDHVFIVVEENHSYEQVVGSSSMPYLNSLIARYGLAATYYANSHYSIPNYFWLTTGNYVTLSDGTTSHFNVDNVTRYLLSAGKTWKAYMESLPSVGYTGPSTGDYEKNHDPFAYLSDVVNSSQVKNIVPFTQLASDINNNTLPNYGFITPNGVHDGHNGGLSTVDQWLQTNIAPLLATTPFQAGGNGILFITFDESVDSDCRPLSSCPSLPENGGGGRVTTVVISPMAKSGFRSTTKYQHPSTLRTMLSALGASGAPGAAANAPLMSDLFGSGGSTNYAVTIATPAANATVSSPFTVSASFNGTASYMKLWVDGVSTYTVFSASTLTKSLALASGKHHLTVQASNGTVYSSSEYVTVQ
jgi:acid phosphatase